MKFNNKKSNRKLATTLALISFIFSCQNEIQNEIESLTQKSTKKNITELQELSQLSPLNDSIIQPVYNYANRTYVRTYEEVTKIVYAFCTYPPLNCLPDLIIRPEIIEQSKLEQEYFAFKDAVINDLEHEYFNKNSWRILWNNLDSRILDMLRNNEVNIILENGIDNTEYFVGIQNSIHENNYKTEDVIFALPINYIDNYDIINN